MKTPNAGLPAWWLRHGGALLAATCVASWLLPLPSWGRALWNVLVFLACVYLLLLTGKHRSRGGDGGGDEA